MSEEHKGPALTSDSKQDLGISESKGKAYAHTFSKKRIIKNLIIVSFAFMFLFTAFQALGALQSSLNKEEGLGVYGLAIIYGALIVSCLFLPTPLIALLGCKWTIVVSMCCYVLYIVANFYAIWGTIAPSSVILGFGAAPLWSAKCTYLTETAIHYGKLTGESKDAAVNKFFGIFFAFFQTSSVWGNLISSLVFSQKRDNETEIPEELLAKCGAAYCTGDETIGNLTNVGLEKPPYERILMLVGIYAACGVIAIAIVIFLLDKLALESKTSEGSRKFSFDLFIATFKHMRRPEQILLIPLTMYSGFEQGFLSGDFTKSYVSCTVGIWNVGYVMICYGVVDAICSFTFGRLVKYLGRIPFFVFGALLHFGLQLTFLLWKPTPDHFVVYFVLAGLWGMGDAIWQTQINALYGVVFQDNTEPAFSNYRLWESLAFVLAYVFSFQLCVNIKIYILIGVLGLGMMGYLAVEIIQRRQGHNSGTITKD
ncbi:protein unc-93 homolog A [Lingula anatina]|uniref:Protein unc-93 homolog A n=1 Tax=Lingula anatina TaxID=7574 RepID=A0A1S3JTC2_LINAN|nr:protein unc-93 homolog A [Lingula anatina]XP_013413314.1 protein unc-93 homolog A [Lingula anatina]XP_013413315.1 protein unc-93 homolog A [Lingula anatina]|eukprot:XP_013413313.1 protein unc-93 homolog A [Lingula anatina]